MQEIGGDMGYQQSRKFYHIYIEQSLIGAIIMSHLATTNCKLGSKNIMMLNNHVNTRTEIKQ